MSEGVEFGAGGLVGLCMHFSLTHSLTRSCALYFVSESSKQKSWGLTTIQIKTLNDEKEAHLDFLHLRAKQQAEERVHFRKAWSRRRSSEQDREGSGVEAEASDDAAGNAYGLWRTQSRLRRLRRFS